MSTDVVMGLCMIGSNLLAVILFFAWGYTHPVQWKKRFSEDYLPFVVLFAVAGGVLMALAMWTLLVAGPACLCHKVILKRADREADPSNEQG